MLRNDDGSDRRGGLAKPRNSIRTGLNSGFQALGIAIHAGATKIVLCGFDMCFEGERSHWHGGHPIKVGEEMYRNAYAKHFNELQLPAGIEVLNASERSLLRAFKKVPLEEALA